MDIKPIPQYILDKANQYIDAPEINVRFLYASGQIIGEEVDEEGNLLYVVREDGAIGFIYSSDCKVALTSMVNQGEVVIKKRVSLDNVQA